ncbi:globin [Phenylobacterium sp.]|uniref:globin n=1 Tax=Phenylobacterium sp. TaxID=1871053 RepID=UPI00272FE698|nr:globin [Phenylobacterium sp.]MDP1875005.1 globin [Phenylobacterium sp.]MDP3491171.1 globin [Phenylobacterium sp.]
MVMDSQALLDSLDLVADRSEDPAPLVYERLFARYPETEPLFMGDTRGAARGQMLRQAIETLLDYLGPNAFAANFLRAELRNHDDIGVPGEIFPRFYQAMAEAFADILGEDWTPAMQGAWNDLTAQVEQIVQGEPQTI